MTQLGASVGVAVIGTLFFTQLHHDPAAGHLVVAAYGHAFSRTLRISIGLLIAALVASYVLPRRTAAASPATEPASNRRNDARLPD